MKKRMKRRKKKKKRKTKKRRRKKASKAVDLVTETERTWTDRAMTTATNALRTMTAETTAR